MAEKPSGQCEYCGHMRYTNDLFNGECVPCVMWAQEQINGLTREVAALKQKVGVEKSLGDEARLCVKSFEEKLPGHVDALRAEVERLTEALAKYTTPLTVDQAAKALPMVYDPAGFFTAGDMHRFDAAIRAAREGER